MSLNVAVYQDFLRDNYGGRYWEIINLIISTESLIAGGSILSAFHGYYTHDIDIYVHVSHAMELKAGLMNLGYQLHRRRNYVTPPYDESFFKKNGILGRYRFFDKDDNFIPVDVMIIPDRIDIKDVVTNFDLTFCEVWYDGKELDATDPQGVLEMRGMLRAEYTKNLLIYFNLFTIKRIKKYVKRGFHITYDCNVNGTEYDIRLRIHKRTVTNPEEWVVLALYSGLIRPAPEFSKKQLLPRDIYNKIKSEALETNGSYLGQELGYNLLCMCPLNGHTMEDLNKVIECLHIPADKRNKFLLKCFANYNLDSLQNNETYLEYFVSVTGISKEELDDFIPKIYSYGESGETLGNSEIIESNSWEENSPRIEVRGHNAINPRSTAMAPTVQQYRYITDDILHNYNYILDHNIPLPLEIGEQVNILQLSNDGVFRMDDLLYLQRRLNYIIEDWNEETKEDLGAGETKE